MKRLLPVLALVASAPFAHAQPVPSRAGGIRAPGANPTWSIGDDGSATFKALAGDASSATAGGVSLSDIGAKAAAAAPTAALASYAKTIGAALTGASLDSTSTIGGVPVSTLLLEISAGTTGGVSGVAAITGGSISPTVTVSGTPLSTVLGQASTALPASDAGLAAAETKAGTALQPGAIGATVAAQNDSRITGALPAAQVGAASGVAPLDSNKLLPLVNLPAVPAANLPIGSIAGTVAAGNDSRITGALPASDAGLATAESKAGTALQPAAIGTAVAAQNDARITGALPASQVGAASGVAPLDSNKLLPAANLPVGTAAGTVAAGNDSRIAGALPASDAGLAAAESKAGTALQPAAIGTTVAAQNDSRITGALPAAQVGAASGVAPLDSSKLLPVANLPIGTIAGTVAAGNDSRITGALPASDAGLATAESKAGTALQPATIGTTVAAQNDARITGALPAAALPTTPLTSSLATVARTLADRFSDSLNVKDYGAKCDGVTDDTSAIQRAISVATGAAGGPIPAVIGIGANPNGAARVVLPSGACVHNGTLTANLGLNSSFALVGDGTSNTQLIMTGQGDGLDINFASNPRTSYGTGGTDIAHTAAWPGQAVWIKGINFQNGYAGINGTALAITGVRPIYANLPPPSLLQDVAVSDVAGYGKVTAQSATVSTSSWGKGIVVTDLSYLFASRLDIVDHTGSLTQGIEYQTTATAADSGSTGSAAAQQFICQDCIQFGGQNFLDVGGYGVQTVYLDRPQWHTSKLGVTWLAAANGASGSLYIDKASGSSGVADLHATGLGTVSVHDGFWYAQGTTAGTAWHGLWYDGDSWVQSSGNTIDGPGVGAVGSGSPNGTFGYGEVVDNLGTSNLANLPSTVVGDTAVGVDYGFRGLGANVSFGTIQCGTGTPNCFSSDYTGSNPGLNPHWSNVQDGTNTVWADAAVAQQIHASLQHFFGAGLEVGMPGVALPGVGAGAAGTIDFHSAPASTIAGLNDADFRIAATGGVTGTGGQGGLAMSGTGGIMLNGPIVNSSNITGLNLYATGGLFANTIVPQTAGSPVQLGSASGVLIPGPVGTPSAALVIDSSFLSMLNGPVLAPAFRFIGAAVPTSATSPCDQGTVVVGAASFGYGIFDCFGTNQWASATLTPGITGSPTTGGGTATQGPAGASYLTGTGAPASTLGNNGDSYSDNSTGEVYTKSAGAWTDTGKTLHGAAGAAATIAPGTATALAAGASPTVSNSGTNGAAVFNFGIPAGTAGAAGFSFRTGSGAPASSLGINGDSYEDNTSGEVYGKASGAWTDTGYSLRGPAGTGSSGGTPTPDTQGLAAYTVPVADCNGTPINMTNASGATLTIPTGLTSGCHFQVAQAGAAGSIAITAGSGMTLPAGTGGTVYVGGAGQHTDILVIGTEISVN